MPFFCFSDQNVSSIDDLNFNQLKTCQENETNKYIVIVVEEFKEKTNSLFTFSKQVDKWHNQTADVTFELMLQASGTGYVHGKILKIFHKEYKPTTTN